jgi:hypothetical protein
MDRFPLIAATLGTALTFSVSGCGKNPQSSSPGSVKLSIRVMSAAASPKAAIPQAQQVTITSAKVVLDEIELESSSGDSLDFESDNPLAVNLNLAGAMTVLDSVSLPFGTYNELELEIHELESEDGVVYLANPDLQNLSIYVKGYVDGDTTAVFVFTSDLEAEQEQEFSPPLVIDANSPSTNVVLTIDTSMWFSDGTGGYLDPRVSQNQDAIERNIKASIDVFEDEDDDGDDDDDDDSDDDDSEDD